VDEPGMTLDSADTLPEPVTELVLRAYGRIVSFTATPEAIEAVLDRLPPTYRVASGTPERRWSIRPMEDSNWEVLADDGVISVRLDMIGAVEGTLSNLELWVAEHAKRNVFIHAGCVSVNGKAIVLPGRSMSGKSSLTAALVRAGADYYSDEYAVLDARGLVRPYARMLAVRPHGGGASLDRIRAEDLGGRIGRGVSQVALVAVLQFTETGWDVRPLTRGQTMLRMLDNTVAARSRPRAALGALESATSDAIMMTGERGEADEAADLLLRMLPS